MTGKGNPYHRKGGKGGGQFVKQSDVGVTNATDNQKKGFLGRKPKDPKKLKPQPSPFEDRGGPEKFQPKRPKALPIEKEIIVGENAPPPPEDNPQIKGSGGAVKLTPKQEKTMYANAKKFASSEKHLHDNDPSVVAARKAPGRFNRGPRGYSPPYDRPNDNSVIVAEAARKAAGLPNFTEKNNAFNAAQGRGNMGTPIIKVGDTVEFANPMPNEMQDGKSIKMKVLEDRGDRVLVEYQVPMGIKPTGNVSKEHLKPPLSGVESNDYYNKPLKRNTDLQGVPHTQAWLEKDPSAAENRADKAKMAAINDTARSAAGLLTSKQDRQIKEGIAVWENSQANYMVKNDHGGTNFDAKALVAHLDNIGIAMDPRARANVIGHAASHAWDKPEKKVDLKKHGKPIKGPFGYGK